MKINYFKSSLLIACLAFIGTGCSDWLEVESENKRDLNETTKTEAYFAALREWKKTPGLPQIYVWFDNWSGVSPAGSNSLRGLPDSVTIASNWGGHPKFELSPERKADMEYVQQVKGTKVVVTLFSAVVGDDMPWEDVYDIGGSLDEAVVRPAIRRYAEAIYDAVVASGYDGFDWDFEPSYGPITNYLWVNPVQNRIFIEELGYYFGSGSQRTDRDGRKEAKPGLLLIVDGQIDRMRDYWESQYIDYFVLQAYGSKTEAGLASRVDMAMSAMQAHIDAGRITEKEFVSKTILTENFESFASTGGGFLMMSNYVYKPDGLNQQIGGCGIYRVGFDYQGKGKGDYNGSPEYYFLRKGITNMYSTFYDRAANSSGSQSAE